MRLIFLWIMLVVFLPLPIKSQRLFGSYSYDDEDDHYEAEEDDDEIDRNSTGKNWSYTRKIKLTVYAL